MNKITLLFCMFVSAPLLSQNMTMIDSLTVELAKTKEDTSKINFILDISREYQAFKPRLCYKYASDALNRSIAINWDMGKLKSLRRMGYVMNTLEKGDSSLLFLNRALEVAEKLSEITGQANIYLTMGLVYDKKGETAKAIDAFQKAASISNKTQQGKTYALAHSYIAGVYMDMANNERAIFFHTKAYAIADSVGDFETIAVTLGNLASAYTMIGNYAKAKEYYFEQLALARKIGGQKLAAATLNNIGNLYFKQNELDSALVYYTEALKIGKETGDKMGVAIRLHNIASVNYSKGENGKAIEFFMASLDIRKEIGDKNGSAQCYNNLAECYVKEQQYDKALETVAAGQQIATEITFPKEIIHSYQIYSLIYSAKHDFKKAFEYKELETRIKDSVSQFQSGAELAAMQVKFDSQKKEAENKVLLQENEIQALTISNSRYVQVGLVAVLFLFIIVALLIFRQRKLNNEQKTVRLEQKLLRSQMNPHFIFNSLQAIQNYILKNDGKEAVKYLSSFAMLTRSVLENSRMEIIPLKKEIALLEDYLALQKLRFGDHFEYGIKVADGMDTQYLQLPPMLAQPFIENALEHGMKGINSGGLITVSFYESGNNLMFEIMDNGKGINPSVESRDYGSLATTITRERIELLNRKSSKKIVFEISEAYPDASERKGVRVNFTIPL